MTAKPGAPTPEGSGADLVALLEKFGCELTAAQLYDRGFIRFNRVTLHWEFIDLETERVKTCDSKREAMELAGAPYDDTVILTSFYGFGGRRSWEEAGGDLIDFLS